MNLANGKEKEKVKVWPEMVLRETIAALIALIILLLAAMYFQAPLEEIADPSFSMNPSKAPWYFLGLQELLVYFTPWFAGVIIPLTVILALMAIPYVDVALKTASGSKHLYVGKINTIFTAGLLLWCVLTIIGLFFRGPNWELQWLDGSLLKQNHQGVSPVWLTPLIICLYGLHLWYTKQKNSQKSANSAPWQRLIFHLVSLGGFIIMVRIIFSFLTTLSRGITG